MRYDTCICFTKEGTNVYDPDSGDYIEGVPVSTPIYASVMDTQTEMLNLVYGKIKQGSLTIQLQNAYEDPFDYILIGGKKYGVDFKRNLRTKQTYIVSEIQ